MTSTTKRKKKMDSKLMNQFVSNVNKVIAVKAGKGHKVIAEMKDGSEVVLKKSGNLKAFVNVFDVWVNGNAGGTAGYCTFNNKSGVKNKINYKDWATPIASFQITEAA